MNLQSQNPSESGSEYVIHVVTGSDLSKLQTSVQIEHGPSKFLLASACTGIEMRGRTDDNL